MKNLPTVIILIVLILGAVTSHAQIEILVSDTGQIKGVLQNGGAIVYSRAVPGAIDRVGAIQVTRNSNSGTNAGKVRRIANNDVSYNSSGSNAGKVDRIGDLNISYYLSGAEEGKVRGIGTYLFAYSSSSDASRGKIRNITGSDIRAKIKIVVEL